MDALSLFKCKNCGAELDTRKAVGGVIECGYCHTPWTVPKEETTPEALKYLHDGNAALDVCKFEDAHTYFQKAAELDQNEPEAYFGMALASFKVQFLRDEVNNCLQPICHEISEKAFADDKNYKKALELASVEQKRIYRRKGGEIDDIRDEFFSLKKSGLNYDCFLCVKVTEEDGKTHTEDYNRANDIYYHLKDNGYKPFYSEREMKGRTGSAYEALILYALYTSECMLIVCSDEGYLQTKWVKNEFTRFISLMQEGGKERDALTFVFTGKPIEKLPNGKKIQGIDLAKPDAYSRITEYVESHTPAAKKRQEKKKEEERKKREEEEAAQRQRVDALQKKLEQLEKQQVSSLTPREAEWRKREEELSLFQIENRTLVKYFDRLGVTSVTIPEGVISIGNKAFYNRSSLEKIIIPESVRTIGDFAFSSCSNLKEIVIPPSVTTIGENALSCCPNLKEIVIPGSVTSIGNHAFSSNVNVTSIKIEEGVTAIGEFAFFFLPNLKEVILPSTVTTIEKYAFKDCSSLEEIVLPSSVTSIGESAFQGCSNLKGIVLPESITTIGERAFQGCKSLEEIVIPASVTMVGEKAFYECSNLKEITISNSKTVIGTDAFWFVSSPTAIHFPDDMLSITSGMFGTISMVKDFKFPKSVTTIGDRAFNGMTGLNSITIPNGVTSIGEQAFENCSDLTKIVIPKSVTTIGARAFKGCSDLKSIQLSEGLTYIGDHAFDGCAKLAQITIPNSVTFIGKDAFLSCRGLKKVTLSKQWKGFMNSGLKKIFEAYTLKYIQFTFTE